MLDELQYGYGLQMDVCDASLDHHPRGHDADKQRYTASPQPKRPAERVSLPVDHRSLYRL